MAVLTEEMIAAIKDFFPRYPTRQAVTLPALHIVNERLRYVPLEAGDLFSTGAAGGVAAAQENAEALYLKPGAVVDASLEGIMTLRNHIV